MALGRNRLIFASIAAALMAFAAPAYAATARIVDSMTEAIHDFAATVAAFALAVIDYVAGPAPALAFATETPAPTLGAASARSFRSRLLARLPDRHGRAPLSMAFATG